jgi:hypothetical protein
MLSKASSKRITPSGDQPNHRGRHEHLAHGGIQGFNAPLGYYPDSKITVAVLSNLNGNAPDEMLPKLAAVAHGQAVQLSSERREIKLSRETLATYAALMSCSRALS